MDIAKIATIISHDYEIGKLYLAHMYRIKLFLPKDANASKIANYLEVYYPQYEAHSKAPVMIGEENLPTISVGEKKHIESVPITTDFSAKVLVDEYKTGKEFLPNLLSLQLWIPENFCPFTISEYINSNYFNEVKAAVKPRGTLILS